MMQHRFALPALATALVVLLAAECLLPGALAPRTDARLTIPAAAPDAADDIIGQWGDTILARPLFNPSRRPAATAGAAADTSLPRLSAIIITGATSAAVFAVDGQKPQVIAAGGAIAGYRVGLITPGSVQLRGPDGSITLRPQFVTAAPAAPTSNNATINEENPN